MKKSTPKLSLSKETLLNLNEDHLKEALGGLSKADTLCCPTNGSRYC
jgi:hypothetical protein